MNGILLIDKPSDWTSHDVVAKLRGVLKERRIGHSGTLDPMATGLLVLFLGRATRAVEFAESHEKEYLAGLRLGITTDTQDITGTTLKTCDESISKDELLSVLPEFLGEISQIPPMYSAIKIDGQRLYQLARRGIEVERKSRSITINEISLVGQSAGDFDLRVVCSKGTYIRTLCHDIGIKLETGGALSSLRRTRAGNFSVDDALTIDRACELMEKGEISQYILPVDSLFSEYSAITASADQEAKCLCGNSFNAEISDGCYRVYAQDGRFLMLGQAEGGKLRTVKSFFEV